MTFDISRIAIVGAGPAGLAFAKHLVSRSFVSRSSESPIPGRHLQPPEVVVFEQTLNVGGVWNYTPTPAPHAPPRVPHTDPFCPPALPNTTDPPLWASPMYEKLHTNIPSSLMEFANTPFPEEGLLFPDREVIREYLERYADGVRDKIRFGWRVDEIRRRGGSDDDDGARDKWDVRASHVASGNTETTTFDAVVVANGHYSIPFVPDIPRITMFDTISPGIIQHAKTFRSAEAYRGQRTIVVGNGPSGLDIARQISTTAAKPLYLSVRTPTSKEKLAHLGDAVVEVPEIAEFLPDTRGVVFAEGGDGPKELHNVDSIVMCTGYMYNYAILPDLAPTLLGSGKSVHHTYRHLFYAPHPTLVFPGLPTSVVPFPFVEAQAAVAAAAWANALPLPCRSEREAWVEEYESQCGKESLIDKFAPGQDGRYINDFYQWWDESGRGGRKPPQWDARKVWQRSVYAEARMRFEAGGEVAKTFEELGLFYPGGWVDVGKSVDDF